MGQNKIVVVRGKCLHCGQQIDFHEEVPLATANLNWALRRAAEMLLAYFVKTDVRAHVTCGKCGRKFELFLMDGRHIEGLR